MTDRPLISVIIPCYNEEETVPILRERMECLLAAFALSHAVEILFVDDGSTDGTRAALEAMAPEMNARVLAHAGNRGIAAAFRTGFREARGDFVCTLDADCTVDPLELVPMVAELESTGADVVTASPHHPEGAVEGVQPWRLLLSRGASRIYEYLLPVKLYSYTMCVRVFRRSALERIDFRSPGFLGVTEMIVSAILQGRKVIEWPVTLRRRTTGVSKIRTLRVVADHVRFMGRLLARKLSPSPASSAPRT